MLGLFEKVVCNKVIMLKSDLLIVKNATQGLYKKQDESISLYQFDWLKSITGFFYLQINILKFIFEKTLRWS